MVANENFKNTSAKKSNKRGGKKKSADPLKPFENNLKAWRLKLSIDGEGARAIVDSVIDRLAQKNHFHYSELAKFKTHMLNGVTCPGEYGQAEENALKVSCL